MKKEYPAKIIIAWTEAVAGNSKIRDWLTQNGYPELGLFCFALTNRDSARKWLLANDQPHLMALVRGAEGDINALLWLKKYKFDILEKVARGGDNDDKAINWLVNNNFKDFANLSLRIRAVKNEIENDNQDVHKFNID